MDGITSVMVQQNFAMPDIEIFFFPVFGFDNFKTFTAICRAARH